MSSALDSADNNDAAASVRIFSQTERLRHSITTISQAAAETTRAYPKKQKQSTFQLVFFTLDATEVIWGQGRLTLGEDMHHKWIIVGYWSESKG